MTTHDYSDKEQLLLSELQFLRRISEQQLDTIDRLKAKYNRCRETLRAKEIEHAKAVQSKNFKIAKLKQTVEDMEEK